MIDITVPALPESVSDAQLLDWKKPAGARVARDEVLVEVETDKIVLEVAAPQSGVLAEICHEAGATVTAGEVLARLQPGEDAAAETAPAQVSDAQQHAHAQPSPAQVSDAQPATAHAESQSKTPPLSPAVRRLLDEHDLNPARINGSGRDGRITKEDVLAFLAAQTSESSPPAPPKPAQTPSPVKPTPPQPTPPEAEAEVTPSPTTARAEKREPMSRLRRTIAERLLQAQQGAALLTTFNQVNMRAITELRARMRDDFEKTHGARLGFMSFFVRACADALQKFPHVNARIDGGDIVTPNYADIGIAVSSPRGLVVPVLRNCESLGFAEIETQIRNFGALARDAKIGMDDLAGGTFTITNGGVFGSLLSTPIVNPPQSAILGMHTIEQRPVAEDGAVVIRPMMYVALSYDHRIIDGQQAVGFLVAVKNALEDPARMLLRC